MTDRHDGIDFDRVPIPAVMVPDSEAAGGAIKPFGLDTVAVPAVVLRRGYTGAPPGDPFFLAGQVRDPQAQHNDAIGPDGMRADAPATVPTMPDDAAEVGTSATSGGLPPRPAVSSDPRRTALKALQAIGRWRQRHGAGRKQY